MRTNRQLSRRTLLTSASAGLATTWLAGRETMAHPDQHGAPILLRYQGTSANIPTPREQTVVVDSYEINVFDSFNPYIPNGEAYQYGLNQICRECLFYANFEQGEIIPWLAEKWAYNADFTELTLTLNPNARWSDGQPYTSDDVLFSLDMLADTPGLFGGTTVQENVERVTAPDPQTVVIALNGPRPRFHYNFIAGIVSDNLKVAPKHIWEGQDPNTFTNDPPVYTGPYVLDQVIPEQFMYVWHKNPDYWNAATLDPQPEYVIFRQALPPDAAVQEFMRGNIDVSNHDVIDYLNRQVIVDQYDNVVPLDFLDPCPRSFLPNFESPSGLFRTAAGRWAMSYLVDRPTIATTVWLPPTEPARYPWAPYQANEKWRNTEIQQQYSLTYDPALAEEKLSEAGETKSDGTWQLNGEDLQLNVVVPGGTTVKEYQIAQTLANNAAEIGLNIQLSGQTYPAWGDAFALGQYDISCHWLCGLALDPYQLYDNFLSENAAPIGSRTQGNDTRMQIPELDAVVAELAVASPDDPQNMPLFDEGLATFMSNLPAIPIVQAIYPFTYGTAYWTGWPTQDDIYITPAVWWAQFLFVIGRLRPAEQ